MRFYKYPSTLPSKTQNHVSKQPNTRVSNSTFWVRLNSAEWVTAPLSLTLPREAFSPGSEYQNYDIRRSECEKMGLAVGF